MLRSPASPIDGTIHVPYQPLVLLFMLIDMFAALLLSAASASALLIMACRTMLSTSISGGSEARSSAKRLGSARTLWSTEQYTSPAHVSVITRQATAVRMDLQTAPRAGKELPQGRVSCYGALLVAL